MGVISLSTSNRQMSVAPLAGMMRQGSGSLGDGGFALGLQNTFSCGPQAVQGIHPLPVLQSLFHQGQGLGTGSALSCQEGSCGACSSSFARVLQPVVCGDEGLRVMETGYRPFSTESEGAQDFLHDGDSPICSSVSSTRRLDGVSRLEGCLLAGSGSSGQPQVSQIRSFGQVYQFKALCFDLSTAPQVFTRVMAPVSAFLRRTGIHICRYLDDWLIQATSRSQVMSVLDAVLHLCQSLGIVVSWEKSHLVQMLYLGILLDSQSFRASPDQKRVEKLLSMSYEFLSCEEQPSSSWLKLLGVLSSIIPLVPGGCLRMRSLQLQLHRSWDHLDQSVLVRWTLNCQRDLEWWLVQSRLEEGVYLSQVSPNLDFWSDASDVGWGAHLGDGVASGLWSPQERDLSINARELLAVERGLLHFASQLVNLTVAAFAGNSTAVAYLRNQGGTRFPLLNSIVQRILRWAESVPLTLAPQLMIMGKNNVLADALS